MPLDVTDDASVAGAVDAVAGQVDHLDVLVNNAGIVGSRTPPHETGPADFLACFGVNLLGPVRVTRAFLALLRAADVPRVVNVSSGMGSIDRDLRTPTASSRGSSASSTRRRRPR